VIVPRCSEEDVGTVGSISKGWRLHPLTDMMFPWLPSGIVAIVFFTSGALFSLIAGRLADLMKRTTLVSGCMLLGVDHGQIQRFRCGDMWSIY